MIGQFYPLGPLFPRFGEIFGSYSFITIHHGGWKRLRCKNRVTQEIIDNTPPSFFPAINRQDKVEWTPAATGVYAAKLLGKLLGSSILLFLGPCRFGLVTQSRDGPLFSGLLFWADFLLGIGWSSGELYIIHPSRTLVGILLPFIWKLA